VPLLLPTHHAAVRGRLDQWLERQGLKPTVVGEFEDSTLLRTFGASGMGAFPAAEFMHDDLTTKYDVKRLGDCDGVEEHFFAVATEKKIIHPLVKKVLTKHR
jgi:LysR family transcriptional activator of nhaA